MVRVETVVCGASHFAVKDCQFCGRLLAFFHPSNAGSIFFSRFPPENLEGRMFAAEVGFEKNLSLALFEGVSGNARAFGPDLLDDGRWSEIGQKHRSDKHRADDAFRAIENNIPRKSDHGQDEREYAFE